MLIFKGVQLINIIFNEWRDCKIWRLAFWLWRSLLSFAIWTCTSELEILKLYNIGSINLIISLKTYLKRNMTCLRSYLYWKLIILSLNIFFDILICNSLRWNRPLNWIFLELIIEINHSFDIIHLVTCLVIYQYRVDIIIY